MPAAFNCAAADVVWVAALIIAFTENRNINAVHAGERRKTDSKDIYLRGL